VLSLLSLLSLCSLMHNIINNIAHAHALSFPFFPLQLSRKVRRQV
jgi:hypothetical protein